jgi:hypothetical protein
MKPVRTDADLRIKLVNYSTVDLKTGCWNWQRSKNNCGYGFVSYDGLVNQLAHRVSYEVFVGPIWRGLCVCHSCDNPACINPEHLYTGTRKERQEATVRKGRAYKGPAPGYRWYTNGARNIPRQRGQAIPRGFRLGFVQRPPRTRRMKHAA